jgi:hypothetical protein
MYDVIMDPKLPPVYSGPCHIALTWELQYVPERVLRIVHGTVVLYRIKMD